MESEEVSLSPSDIVGISIQVVSVKLNAIRLYRRNRIWELSSGFSFTDEDDINNFKTDLSQFPDEALRNISQIDRKYFENWNDLTAGLRENEYYLATTQRDRNSDDSSQMEIEISLTRRDNQSFSLIYGVKLSATIYQIVEGICAEVNQYCDIPMDSLFGRFEGEV